MLSCRTIPSSCVFWELDQWFSFVTIFLEGTPLSNISYQPLDSQMYHITSYHICRLLHILQPMHTYSEYLIMLQCTVPLFIFLYMSPH